MSSLDNPLLSKWNLSGQGLSGSNLVSHTVAVKQEAKEEGTSRKRKPVIADTIDKKKLKDESLSLKSPSSSLLIGTNLLSGTTGSLLKSSSLLSSYGGVKTRSDPAALSGLSSGTSLRPSASSLKSSSLTSSLLTRPADSATTGQYAGSSGQSSASQKRTNSQLSSSTASGYSSGLSKPLSGGLTLTSKLTGGQSHLSSGSSLLLKGSTHLGGGSSLLSANLGLTQVSVKLIGGSSLLQHSNSLVSNDSTGIKDGKSGKKAGKSGGRKSRRPERKRKMLGKYEAVAPEYHLRASDVVGDLPQAKIARFTPPTLDRSLLAGQKLHDVNGIKFALVNAVSGSLICQPNFKLGTDLTRITLVTMSQKVICYDPEFILKLALYTRKQLNIRTTANFLLALSAHIPSCRPYLKKYFSASIALPSDWIEVAEIYSAFPEKTLPLGSLPSALRKAMVGKFPDFDKYQLAKYNKESSQKKKKKKQKKAEEAANKSAAPGRGRGARGRGGSRGRGAVARGRGRGAANQSTVRPRDMLDSDSDSESSGGSDSDDEYEKFKKAQEKGLHHVVYDDGESREQLQQMTFTLKQLIRKLHIVEPVEHVMCLVGKKYPGTLEEFYRCRLPGTFEEERAGKRMKLPVPETWETQVSLKGNKAETWQELLDHKKLPFMAMLRNLRNLIKAGISSKHHTSVIRRLTDERQVINSKQFPFRFFSAYEVLEALQKEFTETQAKIVEEAVAASNAPKTADGKDPKRMKLTADNWWQVKKLRKAAKGKKTKETPYDTGLINRYRKALDTAVKIATVYNVAPIRGRTVIFCDMGPAMQVPCTAAKGLGKPRTMQEVSLLLGLMCKYSCEECSLIIFNSSTLRYMEVELDKGTILENMATVLAKGDLSMESKSVGCQFMSDLPMSILYDHLRDRTQIDNVLLLTGGGAIVEQRATVDSFLQLYRRIVNPDVLYVNVSFAGKNCGFDTSIKPEHENNIYISGFSDQILRFIAERGDGGQLRHIEKIDEAFKLKPLPSVALNKPAPPTVSIGRTMEVASLTPKWRTARVFISSTFRDMHGERDLLTRFVFPELRALGKRHFINVYEVDLRWGVTEEETRHAKTLELCLTEISKCQLFVGILGNRYGWVPDKYEVPDTQEFDWVRQYPAGASVTELEFQLGAIGSAVYMKDKAFFFIRDDSFESDVPKACREDFIDTDSKVKTRMVQLKEQIRRTGLELFDNYPCRWEGVVDGKPMVSGLEQFAERALANLWTAIEKMYPIHETQILDEAAHCTNLHESYAVYQESLFVGRAKLKKECLRHLATIKTGVIALPGKPGSGKSALMAALMNTYKYDSSLCDSGLNILTHYVGAAPGSTNILATLKRLCHELNTRFSLQIEVPEDFKNIVAKFAEILSEAGSYCGSPLVLFMDGLDSMDPAHLPHNLEWLPEQMPKNVIMVVTCQLNGKVHMSLKRRKVAEVAIETLDMWDKSEVVKAHLAEHRKSLDESPFNNQMKLLVSKKEANVPLYLSLACEELRVYGLFERITLKLKSLPQTVPLLLQEVMNRMEQDLGKDLVSTALSLLVCVRDGLTAVELHDLLTLSSVLEGDRPGVKEITNMQPLPEQSLPSAKFAHLQRALHTLMNPSCQWSSTLRLAHADIVTAIRNRYLKGAAAMETEQFLHRLIAGYFAAQVEAHSKSVRAFQELPFHLARSCSLGELEALLCSLQYIYDKCMLGLAPQLLEDFQPIDPMSKMHEREQAKLFDKERVKQYKSFVSRNLHVLSSHPALTWQQAYNETSNSQPALEVRALLTSTVVPAAERSLVEWSSKPQKVDPCYLTVSNLPQAMTCVAVSPDNQYFASGGFDCLVHLYNLSTGKEVRSYHGHADTISDVCFVGKNKLCSVSLDASVSVWDVTDGHRLFNLRGHNRRVNSCTSDRSGNVLATASWDCTIKVWGMGKGDVVCEFKVGSAVNCVGFHPEGQKLVSGQWDSTIKIWDIFHKTKLAVLRGHKTSVRDVAYSPTGCHIASAALDGDVKLWAADTGAQIGNIHGHALPINKLTFSPTGRELITVSDDHKVKVWSGNLGKPVAMIPGEELGPAMSVAILSQSSVAVGYHSGLVVGYDLITGAQQWKSKAHSASVRCLCALTSGYILSGSDDGTAKVLKENQQLVVYKAHTKGIMGMDHCNDYIALASEDCTCTVFENPVKHGRKPSTNDAKRMLVKLGSHTGPVTACSFNQMGNRLATASRDMSVRIWDVINATLQGDEGPTPLHIIHQCHDDWVTDIKWSNTADVIITSSNDFNLKVWDVSKIGDTPGETQKTSTRKNICREKYTMTGHMASINHIAYRYGCVVSTCADGTVKTWSHKGVQITTLYGHTQRANGCDIFIKLAAGADEVSEENGDWASEDREDKKIIQPKLDKVMVATVGEDGSCRVWYPLQANELASLTGHSNKVLSVSSSHQGKICTSSLDRSVKLWSCGVADEDGQSSDTVLGEHNAPVTLVCANPYARVILSGSRDGYIKLWSVDSTDGGKYKCSGTLQAHEMAVTCACWLDSQTFVTGSDDTKICVWTYKTVGNAMRVQQSKLNLCTSSPILSMTSNNNPDQPLFFTTEWSGMIQAWSTNSTSSIARTKTMHDQTSWLLKVGWAGNNTILVTTMTGSVLTYDVSAVVRKNDRNGIKEIKHTVVWGPTAGATVSRAEPSTWILDVNGDRERFVTAGSDGQVSYMADNQNLRTSLKVHADQVTCVLQTPDESTVFTGSRDKTVKIWNAKMEQMGQFFCQSPVTSMCLLPTDQPGQLTVAYGDQLGFVHFLIWKSA